MTDWTEELLEVVVEEYNHVLGIKYKSIRYQKRERRLKQLIDKVRKDRDE